MKTVLQVSIPPLGDPLEPRSFRRSTDTLCKALRGVSISDVHTVALTAARTATPEARRAQWLMARQLVRELSSRGNVHLLATPALLAVDEEVRGASPSTFSSEWTPRSGIYVHCEAYATFVSLSGIPDVRVYTDLFERVEGHAPHSVVSGAPKLWLYDGDAWADREQIQKLHAHLTADGNGDYAPDVVLYCSGVSDQAKGPLCVVVKPGHPIWFLDADPNEPTIHHLEFPSDRDRRADRQFFRLRIQHNSKLLPRAVRLEVGEDLSQRDLWWSPLYREVHDQLERLVEQVAAKELSVVKYPVGSYWPDVIPLWCRMVGDPIQRCRDGRLDAIHDPDGRPIVVRRVPSELLFPELGKEAGKPAGRLEPLAARIRPFVELITDNLAIAPNSRVRIVLVVHDFDELVDNQERGGQPEHAPGETTLEDGLRRSVWRALLNWVELRSGQREERVATSLMFLFRHDRHQAIRDNLVREATLQDAAHLLGDHQDLFQLSAQRVVELVRTYRRLVPVSGQGQAWAIHGEFLHPVMDYLLAETTAEFVRLVDEPDDRQSGRSTPANTRLGAAASGAMTWLSRELDAVCGQEGAFYREGCALQKYFEDGPKARTLPLPKVRPVLEKIAERVKKHNILEYPFHDPVVLSSDPEEGEVLNTLAELGYLEKSHEGYTVRKPLVFLGWSRWNAHGEASMFASGG